MSVTRIQHASLHRNNKAYRSRATLRCRPQRDHSLNMAIHCGMNSKPKKHMKNLKLTLLFTLLFSLESFSHQSGNDGIKSTAITSGIGLGSVLAVVVSWERNKSVLLAFLHGIFSWFYVLYFVLTRKPEERHKK